MASSRGKARNRAEKHYIKSRPNIRSRLRATCHKCADTPHRRQPYQSVSIPQLVYELLTIDKYNQDAKRNSLRRYRTPRRMLEYHERRKLPYEPVNACDSSESIQVPEYGMESRRTSIESLTEVMDAANSSAPISSANSSVSNVTVEPIELANSFNNARSLFKEKSLMQLINNYIRAGIDEGKRQAKKYIRKALSFGVRSGYLIPANPRGNMLRVCPTLTSSRRTDAESRRRRRIARRGETRITTIDDRKAMRRGIPRIKSRDNAPTSLTVSKRKHRKSHPGSPTRNLSPEKGSSRKSSEKSTLHERNKPKINAKRKNKIGNKINNKRTQQRKNDDTENIKMPIKRRRMGLSPNRTQNDRMEEAFKDDSNRNQDKYKSNRNNRNTITERRKSMSRREDGSRMEKQKSGLNIDDNHDIEDRNNDDEKSEEASVEHDVNGTNGEIDA